MPWFELGAAGWEARMLSIVQCSPSLLLLLVLEHYITCTWKLHENYKVMSVWSNRQSLCWLLYWHLNVSSVSFCLCWDSNSWPVANDLDDEFFSIWATDQGSVGIDVQPTEFLNFLTRSSWLQHSWMSFKFLREKLFVSMQLLTSSLAFFRKREISTIARSRKKVPSLEKAPQKVFMHFLTQLLDKRVF